MKKRLYLRIENESLIGKFDEICEYLDSTRHEMIEDFIEKLVIRITDELSRNDYNP